MQEIDAWLADILGDVLEPEVFSAVSKEIKAKLLESYRNGQNAPKANDRPQRTR